MGKKTVPCDRCDKPIVLGQDLIYTPANKFNDDDELISARHGRCQPSPKELHENVKRALGNVKAALNKMGHGQ